MRGVVFLALIIVTPVSAQTGTGQSGISTSTPTTNVRAYKELRNFGICYARLQRKGALNVIATDPGGSDESKMLRKEVYGEHMTCMFGGTQMQLPSVFARGAIAEGLLVSGGVPVAYRLTAPPAGKVQDLHGVARCYANGNRTNVRALLQKEPGSAEEVAAVSALWNDFKACMPGFRVKLNAPWIRYLLAEALLRLPPEAVPAAGS